VGGIPIATHKDLVVWKKAMELVTDVTHTEEVRKILLGLIRSLKKKPITHHSSPITPSL
jgi:hypothetical protein